MSKYEDITRELRNIKKDIERIERHFESTAKQVSSQTKGLQIFADHISSIEKRVKKLEGATTSQEASTPSA